MSKEDYKFLHALLAEYKWQIHHNLLIPNLDNICKDRCKEMLTCISMLIENMPIEYETRYYDDVCVKESE